MKRPGKEKRQKIKGMELGVEMREGEDRTGKWKKKRETRESKKDEEGKEKESKTTQDKRRRHGKRKGRKETEIRSSMKG